MAINYQRVNWDTTMYVNPENMNQMDEGIEDACNGVDNLSTSVDERIGDMSTLPHPNDDLSSNITAINSRLPQYKDVNVTTGTDTYEGQYYGGISFTDLGVPKDKIIGIYVVSATDNRPATVQLLGASVRAYANKANTTVSIRVAFTS